MEFDNGDTSRFRLDAKVIAFMPEKNKNKDDDEADAILRTAEVEVEEELDSLGGYREYLREQFRLNED